MTATAQRELPDTGTSALGSMYRSDLAATFEAAVIATTFPGPVTANTYPQGSFAMWTTIAPSAEGTVAGPVGQFDYMPAESTAEAIMEIRRRSGLTWEELGDLFDVSRRSVHHWANGKPVTARHDRTIRRMLAALRHLDRGDRGGTRGLLLAVNPATGVATVDLLKDGRFDEAMGSVEGVRPNERHSIPLSRAAGEARRPQVPALLLEAEQDRPEISAKARAVRIRRTAKTTN